MRLGLTDMIGLAASLIFALPLANYAIVRLFAGEVALGVGLLAVAAAMVVLPSTFSTRDGSCGDCSRDCFPAAPRTHYARYC